MSRSTKAVIWYVIGFLVYSASLYAGSRLNPRDMVGGSWTNPYLQAASCISFLCCLIAPWFIQGSWKERIAFFLIGLVLLLIAFWHWYIATA